MLSTDLLPWFDALPPFVGGIPCRFFIACGQPNTERSPLPVLTVLLLHTGERQEEGDGASEREDGTPGVWALQGFFIEDPCRAVIPSAMCLQGIFRVHSVFPVISYP